MHAVARMGPCLVVAGVLSVGLFAAPAPSGPTEYEFQLQPEGAPKPPPPALVLVRARLSDNGDHDGQADTNELVTLHVTLYNRMGFELTGLVGRLVTADATIACIPDAEIAIGSIADRMTLESPDDAMFVVADVQRATVDQALSATFSIEFEADQLAVPIGVTLTLDLDLDLAQGGDPTTFFEGFESGVGTFTSMQIDENLNAPDGDLGNSTAGLINADGYRCQYVDPDWQGSNSYNTWSVPYCYPNRSQADAFWWQVTGDRAFTGAGALYFGLFLDDYLGFTTPTQQLEAMALAEPVNLGWHDVCSETRTQPCDSEIDCPVGEACTCVGPTLSIKHQVSLADERQGSGGPDNSRSVDRGVVQVQLADASGAPQGPWMRLEPFLNAYDTQHNDMLRNCSFDPTDDGNDEDSFFDPTDPLRRLGPSSTCYPLRAFVDEGDTDEPFASQSIGDASDGPGLEGETGIGTWVESRFSLDRFRGRRIRVRFLETGLAGFNSRTWQDLLFHNPYPSDDGWFIDDVTITDTLQVPANVSIDLKDNSGLLQDHDFDGIAAACDCAPEDETAWGAPGEVPELRVALPEGPLGPARLSWSPPSNMGGTAVAYDTLLSSGPAIFGDEALTNCVESGEADLEASDATTPIPGALWFYLVRARNGCAVGPLGSDSAGAPRAGRSCP